MHSFLVPAIGRPTVMIRRVSVFRRWRKSTRRTWRGCGVCGVMALRMVLPTRTPPIDSRPPRRPCRSWPMACCTARPCSIRLSRWSPKPARNCGNSISDARAAHCAVSLSGRAIRTIPHPGEAGYETWPKDNWITAGSPAAWGAATVDDARGLVFIPIGQPAAQYYGAARHGQNLYSSSIVALDANTGALRWHFQLTHHDVWDYDAEAAPSLMDIVKDGQRIPVVVAISKPGLMFFLNRETGESVYPVQERPVPQSDTPGEQTWPTQPFPSKPAPLARQGMTTDEIFTGEPEPEEFCRDLVARIGGIHSYS